MNSEYKEASLTPELMCRDINISLPFYVDILGFKIMYQRPEDGFAMLNYQGANLMLDQIHAHSATHRSWIIGAMEPPFGRGINLQIMTTEVDALYMRVQKSAARIFLPLEEKWYRSDAMELGNRQFIVLDPDGYMLRFAQNLGIRALEKANFVTQPPTN